MKSDLILTNGWSIKCPFRANNRYCTHTANKERPKNYKQKPNGKAPSIICQWSLLSCPYCDYFKVDNRKGKV